MVRLYIAHVHNNFALSSEVTDIKLEMMAKYDIDPDILAISEHPDIDIRGKVLHTQVHYSPPFPPFFV